VPSHAAVKEIPLEDDFSFVTGQLNVNGIDATPDGKYLIIVQTNPGHLYRVEIGTWDVKRIDIGGAMVPAGDGVLLDGQNLYVVQNRMNQIAVIQLKLDLLSGEVVDTITDSDFRVPTTIAEYGDHLYAVNARFDVTPSANTEYEVVKVRKP
jgi:hypothetical protein